MLAGSSKREIEEWTSSDPRIFRQTTEMILQYNHNVSRMFKLHRYFSHIRRPHQTQVILIMHFIVFIIYVLHFDSTRLAGHTNCAVVESIVAECRV